jgi:hypothetical protein
MDVGGIKLKTQKSRVANLQVPHTLTLTGMDTRHTLTATHISTTRTHTWTLLDAKSLHSFCFCHPSCACTNSLWFAGPQGQIDAANKEVAKARAQAKTAAKNITKAEKVHYTTHTQVQHPERATRPCPFLVGSVVIYK